MTEMKKIALQNEIATMLEDEAFANLLATCNTIEELYQVLVRHGVEITIDEVAEFHAMGEASLKNYNPDDLSAEDLDNVAGGGWLKKAGRFLAVAAGGAVIGFAAGVCPALTPAAYGYAVIGSAWVAQG